MKKTDSHIKKTKSEAVFRSRVANWVVNKLDEDDYGIDFNCKVTERDGTVTSTEFDCQVKATDSLEISDEKIKISLEVDKLRFYEANIKPVILAVYDISKENFYWTSIQDYIENFLNKENPKWRDREHITVYIPSDNILNDLDVVRKSVEECQKRIIRRALLGMKYNEGIDFDKESIENLEKIERKQEKHLERIKLNMAYRLSFEGDFDKAFEKLVSVYRKPEKDIETIRAITGLTYMLNIADKQENYTIFKICSEGIEIAQKIGEKQLASYLNITKLHAWHLIIIENICKTLLLRKIQENSGNKNIFNYFLEQELSKIINQINQIDQEIKSSIKNLEVSPILLGYALERLLDMSTISTMCMYRFLGDDAISPENENVVNILDNLSRLINFPDLIIRANRAIGNYYYWAKKYEKSIKHMEFALIKSKEIKDKIMIVNLETLIEKMKNHPNPHETKERNLDNLTLREVESKIKQFLFYLGFDPRSNNDEITNILFESVKDINIEEELNFCENLYITILNTSFLGTSFGVPIGQKLLYCKYGGVISGFHVKPAFESFKKAYCEECKFIKKRNNNWTCTIKWLKDRETEIPEELKKIIDVYRNML